MMKRTHLIPPFVAIVALLFLNRTLFAQNQGFFLDDWKEKIAEIPAYNTATKPSASVTVHVSVDMQDTLNRVPDWIYGNNAIPWARNFNEHATLMADINNLRPHVLRWPGGNLSQVYIWNRSADQPPPDLPPTILPDDQNPWYGVNDDNWQMSTSDYYDLLANTNSTGIITVNYAYARYGTGPDPVANAAHLAADWVRYDNGRSRFWELGNENFGTWEAGYEIDVSQNQDGQPRLISGQLYGQHCRVFIDSMRAAAAETGADIRIGVVAYDAEESYPGAEVAAVWNEGMMPEVGDLADYLIVHSYFTPYQTDSPASFILNSTHVPGDIMAVQIADMAEAGKAMLPVAMTEWNIFAEGSMQQISFINGMHAAMVLGEFVRTGYGLATRWDLVNGWNPEGNDHGMFSYKDEPAVDLYNPRPVFFYMYYFQKYFGDRMVRSSVDGSDQVVSYASSFSSGESGLVLVNKGTGTETAVIDVEHFNPGSRYYYMVLTGGTDNGEFSKKVYLNGYGTPEDGGGPDNYESIKALSPLIEGEIKVSLPARSVVYLMIEDLAFSYLSSRIEDPYALILKLTKECELVEPVSGFQAVANGEDTLEIISVVKDPSDSTQLILNLDEGVLPSDVITLSFSGSGILAPDGEALAAFADKPVENLLPGAAPLLKEAYTDSMGNTLFLEFNMEMLVSGSENASLSLFAGGESGREVALEGIGLDGSDAHRVFLAITDSIDAEDELSLTYAGTQLSSSEGIPLDTIESFPVRNQAPGTPPIFLSGEVGESGLSVTVTFSKEMIENPDTESLFIIQAEERTPAIESVSFNKSLVTLHLALEDYIRHGEFVTLSYSGTSLTSTDRGVLEPFENVPLINTLPIPDITAVPARIEAEEFSFQNGWIPVPCSDDGGGLALAYLSGSNFADYEVDVYRAGFYEGTLRYAAQTGTGVLTIQTPDRELIHQDTLSISATGGSQVWASLPADLVLQEGRQRIRFQALSGEIRINWLELALEHTLFAEFDGAETNAVGDTIRVRFSKDLAEPGDGAATGFTVKAGGQEVDILHLGLDPDSARIVLLTLASSLSPGQEDIRVSCESGTLSDVDGTAVPPFTDRIVVNRVGTGLETVHFNAFRIYPQPAHDRLTIEGDSEGVTGIKLLDLTGSAVLDRSFHTPQHTLTVELDTHPGIYLLRILSVSGSSTSKLIVY